MEKRSGRFIVLEGIDGAGTTTQSALLVERLRRETPKTPVKITREPSDGPIGSLVRQVLTGRIIVPGGRAPGWATMALLFAADRMDHVESDIEPFLAQGGVIVSDRYDASSLAYQSVSSGRGGEKAVEWIRELNKHALRPDLTIVLDLPSEIAAVRREVRGEAAQLYEQNEVQRALAEFYRDVARHMPDHRVVIIDGKVSIDEVHRTYPEGTGPRANETGGPSVDDRQLERLGLAVALVVDLERGRLLERPERGVCLLGALGDDPVDACDDVAGLEVDAPLRVDRADLEPVELPGVHHRPVLHGDVLEEDAEALGDCLLHGGALQRGDGLRRGRRSLRRRIRLR